MKFITNILRHEEIYQSFVLDRLIQCVGAWKDRDIAGDVQPVSVDRDVLQRRIIVIYVFRSSGFIEYKSFFEVLQLLQFLRAFCLRYSGDRDMQLSFQILICILLGTERYESGILFIRLEDSEIMLPAFSVDGG